MASDGLPVAMLERIRRQRVFEADRQEAAAALACSGFFQSPQDAPIAAAQKAASAAMATAGAQTPEESPSREENAADVLLPPPSAPADLDWAAEALGFPLPAVVQQLYLDVGNGGFGPGNGFFGLERLVAEYQDMMEEPAGPRGALWPAALLPIADLDPGFTCLDVQTGRVIDWVPEGLDDQEDEWEGSFSEACSSLIQWLNLWLDQPR